MMLRERKPIGGKRIVCFLLLAVLLLFFALPTCGRTAPTPVPASPGLRLGEVLPPCVTLPLRETRPILALLCPGLLRPLLPPRLTVPESRCAPLLHQLRRPSILLLSGNHATLAPPCLTFLGARCSFASRVHKI